MYSSNLQLKNNLRFLRSLLVFDGDLYPIFSPLFIFFFNFPFCLMCKAFSKKVNFMHMLSLIFSIERDEIHGNMHKRGKTYSEFTKKLTDTIKQIFSLGFLGFLT